MKQVLALFITIIAFQLCLGQAVENNLLTNGNFDSPSVNSELFLQGTNPNDGLTGTNLCFIGSDCDPPNHGIIQCDCYRNWSQPGEYWVGDSLEAFHIDLHEPVNTNNNVMFVDGTCSGGEKVWFDTVEVKANTDYYFSGAVATLGGWPNQTYAQNLVAQLSFYVNGDFVGHFSANTTVGIWDRFEHLWQSGSASRVELKIVNGTSGNCEVGDAANDFALDSLSFYTMYEDVPDASPATLCKRYQHYPFDGDANDISEYAKQGQVYGATPTVDRFGLANSAYQFDGQDDYIVIDSVGSGSFTLGYWLKLEHDGDTSTVVSSSTGYSHTFYSGDDNNWLYEDHKNYIDSEAGSGGSNLYGGLNGTYYHVTQVFSQSYNPQTYTSQIYYNGIMTSNEEYEGHFSVMHGELYVGASFDGNSSLFLKGTIDDLKLYNCALSRTDIDSIYQSEKISPLPDSCYTTIQDTNWVTVYDTTHVTAYDTVISTVTDTLVIGVVVSVAPEIINSMKVYPNPAGDVLTIDNGDFGTMLNHRIEIITEIGQQVYFSLVNTELLQVDVANWSPGSYHINVKDGSNNLVETKMIIVQ